jgi:hypothetical protein
MAAMKGLQQCHHCKGSTCPVGTVEHLKGILAVGTLTCTHALQVGVFMGTGMGTAKIPRGNPCHSLAATKLVRNLEHGACVDEYLQVGFMSICTSHWVDFDKASILQDQIIVFLALANRRSIVKTM